MQIDRDVPTAVDIGRFPFKCVHEAIAAGAEEALRSLIVALRDEDIQISKVSQGKVPVDGGGQDGSFVGERRNVVSFKQCEKFEEFVGQVQVAGGVGAGLVLEVFQ